MDPGSKLAIDTFLSPLKVSKEGLLKLSREFSSTFTQLCKNSDDQFLPTPVSERILRDNAGREPGPYLAIDMVGFIKLMGDDETERTAPSQALNGTGALTGPSPESHRLERLHEKSWEIGDRLKSDTEHGLFAWIGQCIAEVVATGCAELGISPTAELPIGVTFSFPMKQEALFEAEVQDMGKGFSMSSGSQLHSLLLDGYRKAKTENLPDIRIAAIANDTVATLISFIYQFRAKEGQKAIMGLICGTGSNATLPVKISSMREGKWPKIVEISPNEEIEDVRIAVNTEWSIKGSAPPLRKLGLVTKWDIELDQNTERPGFQPLEYMTSGRYLGELGRIMFVDYLTNHLHVPAQNLPDAICKRFGLTTTFLSHYRPDGQLGRQILLNKRQTQFPAENERSCVQWDAHMAEALYQIAKAIEVRAAGIVAAAVVGLLTCSEELPYVGPKPLDLVVGYTGGCITKFQDYLADCQAFIDEIICLEYGRRATVRVLLAPCHDGGIEGAGILVSASEKANEVKSVA